MIRNVAVAAVLALLLVAPCFAQQSADELAVWKLEHSYWENVKALDLPASQRKLTSVRHNSDSLYFILSTSF